MKQAMIRFCDIFLSAVGLIVLSPMMLMVLLLGWLDTRMPLFRQNRVGRNKKPFTLVKFRTMSIDTASVASH